MPKKMTNVMVDRIDIKKLFGMYNYKIVRGKNNPLLILYGDNGCGKTTILNCLLHLLSPEPRSGHRTYIGSVIFKEFKITLSNDIVVMVSRKEVIDGRYSISCLKKTGESILNWEWCPKESPDYIEDEESYDKYCQLMDTLALNIHYLPANRNTDINDQEIERELRARHMGDPRIIERISR